MALSVSLAGSNSGTTSSGNITLGGVNAAVGDLIVVAVAAANSGTSGASSIASCSDGGTNTFSKRGEINQTPGSASGDGATFAWFTAPVTGALSGATIQVNFSPNVAQKAITVYVVSATGGTIDTPTAGGGQTGASSTPSVTKGSVTSGYAFFGGVAAETDDGYTADSDTTNGSWSTLQDVQADGGGDASAMQLATQYKIVTSTGGQTYNPTITGGASRDWAANWLEVGFTAGADPDPLTANGGSVAVTGTNATLKRSLKLVPSAGSVAVSGTNATLKFGHKLTCNGGSVAVTGTDLAMRASRKLIPSAGSVAVTGTNAALKRSYPMTPSAGSVAISGTNAVLRRVYTLGCNGGSVAVTGANLTMRASRSLSCTGGSVAVTGTNATLTKAVRLVANGGSVAVTGSNLGLNLFRLLTLFSGSYTVTGQNATWYRRVTATSNGGSVAYSGSNASLLITRMLVCQGGSVAITGANADLNYVVPELMVYTLECESGDVTLAHSIADLTFNRNFPHLIVGVEVEAGSVQTFPEDGQTFSGGTVVTRPTSLYQVSLKTAPRQEGTPGWVFPSGTYKTHPTAFALNGAPVHYVEVDTIHPTFWLALGDGIDDFYGFMDPGIRTLIMAPGEISVTGASVSMGQGRGLAATTGSVAADGQSVSLYVGRRLVCNGGSIAADGVQVTLFKANPLTANGGSVSVSGSNLDLRLSRRITCQGGEVAISGSLIEFSGGRTLVCEGGTVAITGSDMTFNNDAFDGEAIVVGLEAQVELGTIEIELDFDQAVTGLEMDISVGDVIVWGVIPDDEPDDWTIVPDNQTSGWVVVNDTQNPNWS